MNARVRQAAGKGSVAEGRERVQREALAPLRADFRLSTHSPEQLDRLVEAALQVLQRTGVRVLSPRVRSLLGDHGAVIDHERQTVRMTSDLVLGALELAPRSFVLGARDASCDLDLSGSRTFCTTDGCGVEIVDFGTGRRRASTKDDLAAITRLQDYLGSVAFWWPTVSAGDCAETAQLHELDAGWSNTVKHLQGMVQGERLARYAVEMAEVVAGSREALRRRPVMSDLIGAVSPLVLDKDGVEAALAFAEAGIPVCLCSMPTLGTTAPASMSGALVLGLAEVAAFAAIVQLAHSGAPVLGAIFREWADPRTGSTVQLPRDARCMFLATQLIHRLGLPCLAGYGGTDAELPASWQAGVEMTYDMTMAILDDAELMSGIGLTNTFRLFSLEKLFLDDDLYHRVRCALIDIAFDDIDRAIGVIDDVGPGGHFLGHPHTRRHMREAMVPAITQEEVGDGGRSRDPAAVARDRGLAIVRRYQPEPLATDVGAEIARILAATDNELRSR